MVLTGWIVALEAWRELGPFSPRVRSTRALGALLLVLNSLFAIAWWSSIVVTYGVGPSAEYREHSTAFWLVRFMDLAFMIPVGIVVGLGLLRRRAWALRAGYALAGVDLLLCCAVAAMAAAQ